MHLCVTVLWLWFAVSLVGREVGFRDWLNYYVMIFGIPTRTGSIILVLATLLVQHLFECNGVSKKLPRGNEFKFVNWKKKENPDKSFVSVVQ